MFYYNLTLQKASGITCAVQGNFSGSSQRKKKQGQEIVICHGRSLELLTIDFHNGKLISMVSTEMFGIIHSVAVMRRPGFDCLVISAESGQIAMIQYNAKENTFKKIWCEKVSDGNEYKSNFHGHHLAVDPNGQAIIIASVREKMFIFSSGKDRSEHLYHQLLKPNTIFYHMVDLDVGSKTNPMFACLESSTEEVDAVCTFETALKIQQKLIFYEVKSDGVHYDKMGCTLEDRGNLLIPIPNNQNGPIGVLVCSENYITFKSVSKQPSIRCPIPKRDNDLDDPERGTIFTCITTGWKEESFYFLAQTEQGDVFKITLEIEKDTVTQIKLKYFDTIPLAASMCMLESDLLFIAAEFGNHKLYKIHWKEDNSTPEFSSTVPMEDGDTFFFIPRSLKFLELLDEVSSLSPIMNCCVDSSVNAGASQLYLACGRGPNSTLRTLTPKAFCYEFPDIQAAWAVNESVGDFHNLYILSFDSYTKVLTINETIEDVTKFGFLADSPTLACIHIRENIFIQIHPQGIRHIIFGAKTNDWTTQEGKAIRKCAFNERQVVIALTTGELMYFEVDAYGYLCECKENMTKFPDVICMALPNLADVKINSRFLAVGLENSIQLMSLDYQNILKPICDAMVLPHTLVSLAMCEFKCDDETSCLYLYAGLQNGILFRLAVKVSPDSIVETHREIKYLGDHPVKLFSLPDGVVATSNSSWLCYHATDPFDATLISYTALDYASSFSSDAVLAIFGKMLRYLAIEKDKSIFNETVIPLEYTPKRFQLHSASHNLFGIETDHNAFTKEGKKIYKNFIAKEIELEELANNKDREAAHTVADAFKQQDLPEVMFGAPKSGLSTWASLIQIIDPLKQEILFEATLNQNEAAISMSIVKFRNQPTDEFLLVGITKDMNLNPVQSSVNYISTYKLINDGKLLQFVHNTDVDAIPVSICSFQGKVLIGVGTMLRLYDMGKKKLLRKSENKDFPNQIVSIHTSGIRIVVGDVQESFFYLYFKPEYNQLVMFSDDTNVRYITCSTLLDANTVAASDKFGNIFMIHIPVPSVEDDGNSFDGSQWNQNWHLNYSGKSEILANFYVGEIVSSMQLTTLIPGGPEVLLYTTLSGAIGILLPFSSYEDGKFFHNLENMLRCESNLPNFDHLPFRSYHFAVKNIVDGDLCEQFYTLHTDIKKNLAAGLNENYIDVLKRIEHMRMLHSF